MIQFQKDLIVCWMASGDPTNSLDNSKKSDDESLSKCPIGCWTTPEDLTNIDFELWIWLDYLIEYD